MQLVSSDTEDSATPLHQNCINKVEALGSTKYWHHIEVEAAIAT